MNMLKPVANRHYCCLGPEQNIVNALVRGLVAGGRNLIAEPYAAAQNIQVK